MDRSFHETLAFLRRDRNLSQRKAASELNISQALLSHYENGTREPGLSFICRACDYYGVTADYLLCRSEFPNETSALKKLTFRFFDEMDAVREKASIALNEFSPEEKDI